MESVQRGVGESATDNSTAFGFSLTIGGTGLVVSNLENPPAVLEVFLLIAGASLAMILLSALATAGFTTSTPASLPERARLRGSALNMLSVGLGVATAWTLGQLLGGTLVWLVAGFAAIFVYLVIESLEYAGALRAD